MALRARLGLAAIGAALVVLTAAAAGAQAVGGLAGGVVRGVVRDSGSRQPIPGVVLVMLDSAGKPLGRNITAEDGRYTVAMTATVRRIQFLRIGFRPRVVPVPAAGGTLDVTMATIPTLLATVSVMDQPKCPRRDDRPAAFSLWEQARAALLATVVARDENPPLIMRLRAERRIDGDDRVIHQEVHIDSAATMRSFIAAHSARQFVERGFAYDSGQSRWFNGPDADVMLDDAFAGGYCFRLAEPDHARPREVGLAFSPAQHRRNRIDIDGTLWIDSVTRTLTDIVFRYVGLNAELARVRPGGQVSFRAQDNGTVMIDRWALRFPAASKAPLGSRRALIEAHETGGEVAQARWTDGREWQAPLGRLRGRIVGGAGTNTVVRLLDTDYGAIIDTTGAFEISNLLPGPYSVAAADARLAALGILLRTTSTFTAVRDSTVELAVELPTIEEYAASKCLGTSKAPDHRLLLMRVLMPDGSAAAHARLEIRTAASSGNVARIDDGEADGDGLFHFCHPPHDVPLQIYAEHGGSAAAAFVHEMHGSFDTLVLTLAARRP